MVSVTDSSRQANHFVSDCQVLDTSTGEVSFIHEAEPPPVFPQYFSRPITPDEVGLKLVSC